MRKDWEGQPWADEKKNEKRKKPLRCSPLKNGVASAQKQVDGAALALDFRDQANYYRKAAKLLQSIPDDETSAAMAVEYQRRAEEISDQGYQDAYAQAVARKEQAVKADDFYQAANAFRRIEEYRDAGQLAEACEKRYEKLAHRKSRR